MREAKAFAPGHLTGLFQICTEGNDPLRWGARGSGVSITRGVFTHVLVESSDRPMHDIYINDEHMIDAHVSENVLSKYQAILPEPMNIKVHHTINTPLRTRICSFITVSYGITTNYNCNDRIWIMGLFS